MSSAEYAQHQSEMSCELIIQELDDANDNQSTTSVEPALTALDDTRSETGDNSYRHRRNTSCKLPPDWALIMTHASFLNEYKDFIRNYQY